MRKSFIVFTRGRSMNKKQILRSQAIAIASMSISEMQDHAKNLYQYGLDSRLESDIRKLIDKAIEILSHENSDAMAVSSAISISDL